MTLRTSSRAQQWVLWGCGTLVALTAYVVAARLAYGEIGFDILDPRYHRLYLIFGALFAAFAWETRWNGEKAEAEVAPADVGAGESKQEETRSAAVSTEAPVTPVVSEAPAAKMEGQDDNRPGANEFRHARAMMHHEVPDFRTDGLYLDLLGESAEKGYAPAMAKLGDYAMRRGTWVEAYYWMYRAMRAGQGDVAVVLHEIQRNWIQDGCLSEEENVNDLFDLERGSITRALLGIATNHDADAARAYLREHYPEFL